MKEHFDLAFELTVGLEGGYENDPNDPGGETKYGICKKYHPNIDIKNLTIDQAKAIYYADYWLPAGCDAAEFPMDICLFDSQVNPQNDPRLPGGGNKEIILQNPSDWHEYMILRMIRYMNNSKAVFVKGHIFRVLRLFEKIKQHV
jgi:hypothetical protein